MVEHPVVGVVEIRRSARARRITLSVRPPEGRAHLTLPSRVSLKEGLRFLDSKTEWIAGAQKRLRERRALAPVTPVPDPREAKEYLPRRASELAREHGFRYGCVTVRNTVSRWGSCSARNDLSLSVNLLRLPPHLIDYIILHELCHTVHHNHGPAFHALLDHHTSGRHLALRKELRRYSTR